MKASFVQKFISQTCSKEDRLPTSSSALIIGPLPEVTKRRPLHKRLLSAGILVLTLIGLLIGCRDKSSLVPFIEKGRYGVKTTSGKVILPAQYIWVDSLRDEIMLVRLGKKLNRGLGSNGKWKGDAFEADRPRFTEGLSVVDKEGKWGFIDKTGKLVIGYQYDDVAGFGSSFSEGLAIVLKEGKWKAIDKTGKAVLELPYDGVYNFGFREGLLSVSVKKGDKWGFIDKTGKVITGFQFDEASYFSERLAAVKKGSKFGYIDKTGKTIIDFQFDQAYDFEDGIACVQKGDKWGFIDKTGKVIIDFIYDDLPQFREELIAVQKGDKWGFIDKTGKVIIDFQYDIGSPFREGAALVGIYGERAFEIDRKGKKINW